MALWYDTVFNVFNVCTISRGYIGYGMEKHVNTTCIFCYYQTTYIGLKIWDMQMFEPSHSFYRLDYGNALLYSITLSIINCLYRMQNSDAHQVTCTHKREDITPFFLAGMPYFKFKITVHDPVPHIESTELNNILLKTYITIILLWSVFSLLLLLKGHTVMYPDT